MDLALAPQWSCSLGRKNRPPRGSRLQKENIHKAFAHAREANWLRSPAEGTFLCEAELAGRKHQTSTRRALLSDFYTIWPSPTRHWLLMPRTVPKPAWMNKFCSLSPRVKSAKSQSVGRSKTSLSLNLLLICCGIFALEIVSALFNKGLNEEEGGKKMISLFRENSERWKTKWKNRRAEAESYFNYNFDDKRGLCRAEEEERLHISAQDVISVYKM